jgi:hypothetical protein
MFECLVASVRTEHLPSALKIADAKGRVQLAANDATLFEKIAEQKGELEVFLFPAGPELDEHPRNYVCIRGVFGGAEESADLALRPEGTETDSAWPIYWTLESVEQPDNPIHISAFVTKEGKNHEKTPRRPMLARTTTTF